MQEWTQKGALLQVDKLLQRIKLQASGEAEAPPIALPDWLDEEELDGDDEDVTVEASATGMPGPAKQQGVRGFRLPRTG